jgi:ADP-heptose:LPS heptosyltransferase
MSSKTFLRSRRLMNGPYLARNPVVLGMMAASDVAGLMAPRRAANLPDRPLKVLVANLAHLGDLINTIPMLARLRASPRVAKLGVVIGEWGKPVFELGDLADSVHIYDHWRMNRGGEGLKAKLRRHTRTRSGALREIQAEGYDVAIDTYAYFGNSASLLWGAGIPVRVGLTSGGAGTLYTHRFGFDPERSIPANQARLLEPILGDGSDRGLTAITPPGFQPDPEVVRIRDRVGDFIVLHIGPGRPEKDWLASEWIEVGRRLTALGGEDLVGKIGLRGFATLLSRASGLVTIDTVTGHLAACFQTPTVVVAPGTAPTNLWHPNQHYARMATHPVPCAPCHRTLGCPEMTCLRSVKADLVYGALREMMAAKAAAA